MMASPSAVEPHLPDHYVGREGGIFGPLILISTSSMLEFLQTYTNVPSRIQLHLQYFICMVVFPVCIPCVPHTWYRSENWSY